MWTQWLLLPGCLLITLIVESGALTCHSTGAGLGEEPLVSVDLQCTGTSRACYALWNRNGTGGVDGGQGQVNFVMRGCWSSSPPSDCPSTNCTATRKGNPNYFCCCEGDWCNGVVSVDIEEEELVEELSDSGLESSSTPNYYYIGILIPVVAAAGILLVCRKRRSQIRKGVLKGGKELGGIEAGGLLEKRLDADDDEDQDEAGIVLQLGNEIAHGKYGRVHNGLYGGSPVALKIYPSEHRQYYENERWIYGLLKRSDGDNRNVLKYYGSRLVNNTSHILILERASYNLKDYLSSAHHLIPTQTCIQLLQGISRGLGYLHGEVGAAGKGTRIVLAHRDLSPRNILIKTTPSSSVIPLLSDFGLSVATSGPRYTFGRTEHIAEFSSLAEAGTLRYMAPELLEGAVNLKDCENALKEADVYAGSLVLWEICNCAKGVRIEEEEQGDGERIQGAGTYYEMVYEREIGKDLTPDSVTRYVVTRRSRPQFSTWHNTSLTRTLRDTLREAWDPEPDARLTALCIYERFKDLKPCNKDTSSTTGPLEPITAWTDQNTCLERNLWEQRADSSVEYCIMSGKHLSSGPLSVTGGESQGTMNTELSEDQGVSGGQGQGSRGIRYLENF